MTEHAGLQYRQRTAERVLLRRHLGGLSVTNGYDQYLRRTNSGWPQLQHSTTPAHPSATTTPLACKPSPTTRHGTPYSATYTYLANSPLVSQIIFKQSTTTRMTTTKQYDYLNRLTSISSALRAHRPSAIRYAYNNANQRIRSTLADGSYWLYTYDSLGQVVAGNKYWADGTPVAGQQFDYTFDTHRQPHADPSRRGSERRQPALRRPTAPTRSTNTPTATCPVPWTSWASASPPTPSR